MHAINGVVGCERAHVYLHGTGYILTGGSGWVCASAGFFLSLARSPAKSFTGKCRLFLSLRHFSLFSFALSLLPHLRLPWKLGPPGATWTRENVNNWFLFYLFMGTRRASNPPITHSLTHAHALCTHTLTHTHSHNLSLTHIHTHTHAHTQELTHTHTISHTPRVGARTHTGGGRKNLISADIFNFAGKLNPRTRMRGFGNYSPFIVNTYFVKVRSLGEAWGVNCEPNFLRVLWTQAKFITCALRLAVKCLQRLSCAHVRHLGDACTLARVARAFLQTCWLYLQLIFFAFHSLACWNAKIICMWVATMWTALSGLMERSPQKLGSASKETTEYGYTHIYVYTYTYIYICIYIFICICICVHIYILHMIWQEYVRRAREFDAKAEYRIYEVFGDGRTGLHRAYN